MGGGRAAGGAAVFDVLLFLHAAVAAGAFSLSGTHVTIRILVNYTKNV